MLPWSMKRCTSAIDILLLKHRFVSLLLTRMIQLRHPGPVMEVTEDLRVLLGDGLAAGDEEAPAAGAVLLQGPAIGAVVSVLGQGVGHQQREGDQGEPHHVWSVTVS